MRCTSVCEVPLFDHILSMLWTTVPAFVAAGIVYTVLGFSFAQEQTASLESLNAILSGLEGHFSLDFVAFIPPILMIALAYKRFPVLPVMVACLLSAVAIAVYEGVAFNDLAKMMTSGYVSKTGIKQLDPLLSRGGLLSIMPTVLLLCSGMAFGGILERSRVLEVLLDAVLKGARSAVRLVASVLAAAYIINLGTGSQMLAVTAPSSTRSRRPTSARSCCRAPARTPGPSAARWCRGASTRFTSRACSASARSISRRMHS